MQISLIYSSSIPQINSNCMFWDSRCLARQVQMNVHALVSGIRELGTEVLDPMHIESGCIDLAGLKMDLTNAVIRGYGKAVIDSARVDPFTRQLYLVYHTDITLDSEYNAEGRLLSSPIAGNGHIKILMRNVQIEALLPFDIVKDSHGRAVIDLKGIEYRLHFRNNVRFDLSNLFYGDKELSDSMHQFINSNWKKVSETYSRPIFDIAQDKLLKVIRSYLLTQPLENIFHFFD
ncbi:circadian clock-controlled protein daywake-like [Colias croceus]|uniref:circadian clock-controlled protein daywake-like n=1 Tax=Colias crocea TaxID=72248 RepID=UPI001E27B0E2|nr:circadian clock-controlled protein daywake-like [Colias croceus]